MSDKFILNEQGEPDLCNDLFTWGTWMQDAERRVDRTEFAGGYVSTVFLGLDHRYRPDLPHELFETMVFGGHHSDHQERYATKADAIAGHARVVQMVRDGVFP